MAKTVSDLTVRIGADTVGFNNGLNKAHSSLNKLSTGMAKLAGPLAAAFSVKAIANFAGQSIKAYDEQVQAERGLRNALQGREDVLERLKTQASELKKYTTLDDDVIVGEQKYLASLKLNEEQIKKVIEASVQLSAATGMDLHTSVENLAKTYGGMTGRLSQTIPAIAELTKEQLKSGEAVDYVIKNFKGYAETAAKVGLGPVKQLTVSFGDLKEAIGGRLLENTSETFKGLSRIIGNMATNIMPRESDEIRRQKLELNSLVTAATDSRISTEGRKTAIDMITRSYPSFLKGINSETVSNEQLKNRLSEVNKEYDKKIAYMVKEEIVSKSSAKIVQLRVREVEALQKITDAEKIIPIYEEMLSKKYDGNISKLLNISRVQLATNKNRIENIRKEIKEEENNIQKALSTYSKIYGAEIPEEINKTAGALNIAGDEEQAFGDTIEKVSSTSLAGLKKQLSELQHQKDILPDAEKNITEIARLNEQIEILQNLINNLNKARNIVRTPAEGSIMPILSKGTKVTAEPIPKDLAKRYGGQLEDMVEETEVATVEMGSLFQDMSVGIATSMGEIIAGNGGMETIFSGVLLSFANFAQRFGEMLLAQAFAIEALKTSLKSLNPAIAFIAGTSLIAASVAIKAFASKGFETPTFAEGGLAYGPTLALVGDNRNAMNDPELIAPFSKVKSLITNSQTVDVEVHGKITGRDLELVTVKQNKRNKLF